MMHFKRNLKKEQVPNKKSVATGKEVTFPDVKNRFSQM